MLNFSFKNDLLLEDSDNRKLNANFPSSWNSQWG